MRYRLLGRSGLRVSELCFGAMTFGKGWGWGIDKKDSLQIYNTFLEAGGNFVDTADFYTNGSSESFLGEFMAGHREKIVLATKYTNSGPLNDVNSSGNSRKNMMQSVEASLKRLKTDYIDLYWLHIWENTTHIEEIMRAFDDLVRQGKILYVGLSDVPAWEVSRANMLADLRGWSPVVAVQVEYNLIQRSVEREFLPMSRKLDLGVLAWGPMASGILTGKYRPSAKGAGEKGRLSKKVSHTSIDERKDRIVDTVVEVAEAIGRPPSQVALNWVRQQAGIVIPIIGSSTASQLKDNLACLEFTLDEEHVNKLNEVSRFELGFPHDFMNSAKAKESSFGGMVDLVDIHRA